MLIEERRVISGLGKEDGLLYLMDSWIAASARIQLSWIEANYRLLRYEDLIENDVELYTRVLIDECGLDLSPDRLRSIVLANRFERLSDGRRRGEEDPTHHFRKGQAGDWATSARRTG